MHFLLWLFLFLLFLYYISESDISISFFFSPFSISLFPTVLLVFKIECETIIVPNLIENDENTPILIAFQQRWHNNTTKYLNTIYRPTKWPTYDICLWLSLFFLVKIFGLVWGWGRTITCAHTYHKNQQWTSHSKRWIRHPKTSLQRCFD